MLKKICFVLLLALWAHTALAQTPGTPANRSAFFTTSDGVRLHYLEAGAVNAPAIVFVPGWTMPGEIWQPQINAFAGRYHVIALDPRSQGESDKPPEGNYPERRARDIKELIEDRKLAPAVLVGWSLGVHELLAYVEQFGTESLRALVLVDGFVWDKLDPQLGSAMRGMLQQAQRDRAAFTASFVRSMYKKPQLPAYLQHITQASLQTPTNSAALLIYNMLRDDWSPAIRKLDKPVLVAITPASQKAADVIRQYAPQAKVEVFEDAGHALFVDDAERFNRILQDFIVTANSNH